jgi:hypothetical protein
MDFVESYQIDHACEAFRHRPSGLMEQTRNGPVADCQEPGPLYPMALAVQIQGAVQHIQCAQPGIITLFVDGTSNEPELSPNGFKDFWLLRQ